MTLGASVCYSGCAQMLRPGCSVVSVMAGSIPCVYPLVPGLQPSKVRVMADSRCVFLYGVRVCCCHAYAHGEVRTVRQPRPGDLLVSANQPPGSPKIDSFCWVASCRTYLGASGLQMACSHHIMEARLLHLDTSTAGREV
jgi:hypothetical protein